LVAESQLATLRSCREEEGNMAADSRIQEVVRLIHGMVEPGGGALTLSSFDDSSRDLTVKYQASAAEACSIEDQGGGACAITADMIGAFLCESFQSRGLKIGNIKVESTN
jgi:hypothetical protein